MFCFTRYFVSVNKVCVLKVKEFVLAHFEKFVNGGNYEQCTCGFAVSPKHFSGITKKKEVTDKRSIIVACCGLNHYLKNGVWLSGCGHFRLYYFSERFCSNAELYPEISTKGAKSINRSKKYPEGRNSETRSTSVQYVIMSRIVVLIRSWHSNKLYVFEVGKKSRIRR